jgi:serine/threonine protein kinase/Tfp pilus assembly protein PilF
MRIEAARWRRITDIYHAAIERGPEKRASYLDEACAADEALRKQVEAMIKSHERSGDFIESPAFAEVPELLLDEPANALVGQLIGHYRVESLLGVGGMGEVYLARDERLGREVALKIIKIDLVKRSIQAHERFMREACAAAALRHENIATVYEFGIREETGQYFYAMELIEGETLDQRVRRAGPLHVRTTIDIAQQVTSALTAAEKHGLVHRDLKPDNVMLVSHEEEIAGASGNHEKVVVKIIDFGLAKALRAPVDSMSLTQVGFVGTPEFASPEQFEHAGLDVRSDIYSLGATLWFALTGRAPFVGHRLEEIHEAQQSGALPIEQLTAARVPSGLRSLLASMLALEPASRPSTHDLAARLQRCAVQASGNPRIRVALAAAVIVVLGVSALFVFRSLRTQNLGPNFAAHEKSIAVLPFENRSADKANAYFTDGVQDEILTDLAKIADLKVISRTSVMQYKSGVARNLREIAQQLKVTNVVEGSVQRAGNRVRVNAQLIDARTDAHVWAQTYDRDLSDIFAIQSEIAKAIADELQAKLSGAEQKAVAEKPTQNVAAYDAYLRALAIDTAATPNRTKKVAGLYADAVRLDPQFALAWARLAVARSYLYLNGIDLETNGGAAVKEAADRAMSLQPELGEAWLAQGVYRYRVLRDFQGALQSYEEALRRLPNSAFVLDEMARLELRLGQFDVAQKHCEAAAQLDPRNIGILLGLADAFDLVRRHDEAQAVFDRVVEMSPGDDDALVSKALSLQGQGRLKEAAEVLARGSANSQDGFIAGARFFQLFYERRFDEAINQIQHNTPPLIANNPGIMTLFGYCQKFAGHDEDARTTFKRAATAMKPTPDSAVVVDARNLPCYLSWVYAGLGEKEKALEQARHAITDYNNDAIIKPFAETSLAIVQAQTGDVDSAISALPHLLEVPAGETCGDLQINPLWDPLRANPAFQKLCEQKQP